MRSFLTDRSRRMRTVGDLLTGAGTALPVIGGLLAVFAFLITKIDTKDLGLSVMSTAALGAGAFAGGYVSAKRRRKNGLLMGVLCGLFIFIIIAVLSALFSKATESFSPSAKLTVTLICAGVGGVAGVNSRRPL
ncbi:MAG: TIGR04086 family membrane protein [Ruminococcus sp.]|nr:TIGR04086 family membrane protein [Ruminococcus sp.]